MEQSGHGRRAPTTREVEAERQGGRVMGDGQHCTPKRESPYGEGEGGAGREGGGKAAARLQLKGEPSHNVDILIKVHFQKTGQPRPNSECDEKLGSRSGGE